jgi:hypothetical protein
MHFLNSVERHSAQDAADFKVTFPPNQCSDLHLRLDTVLQKGIAVDQPQGSCLLLHRLVGAVKRTFAYFIT